MAPYYPLYVRRSDGKLYFTKPDGSRMKNEPEEWRQKMIRKDDGDDEIYKACDPNGQKVLDWRRKLGGMLMREIGKNEPPDRAYILADLPQNYRLWDHLTYSTSESKRTKTKSNKTHAAAGTERSDAYLYGHPLGFRKRWRSPNDFFPHLLWLVTDETGDYNNCTCKVCCPEYLEDDKENSKRGRTTATAEAAETKPKGPSLSRPSDVLKQPPKERKPSTQQQTTPTVSQLGRPSAAPPAQRTQSGPQSLEPSTLPRVRTMEQKLDTQAGRFIYRPGEVVWYKKGMAWGLGVVAKRDNELKSISRYRVQPFSHPYHQPKTQDMPQELLRPWLAWSPPPTTCRALHPDPNNQYRQPMYSDVDWAAFRNNQYGPGDAEVDGSILAARQAETTYTPFDPIQSQGPEQHYNGIYIGGEKIWVTDALRLRYGHLTDIMVLHDIVEQSVKEPNDQTNRLILIGDTYSLAVLGLSSAGQSSPSTTSDTHLPMRVRTELDYKNNITKANPDMRRSFTSYWRLNTKSAHVSINDIRGRWYETSLLLPILDPTTFNQRGARGDIPDASCYMNGQGDCNKMDMRAPGVQIDPKTGQPRHRPADIKVNTREEVFGKAVPEQFKVHRGLDEGRDGTRPGSSSGGSMPSANNSSANAGAGQGAQDTAMSGMGLPGFGQDYSSQEAGLFSEGTQGLGGMDGQ